MDTSQTRNAGVVLFEEAVRAGMNIPNLFAELANSQLPEIDGAISAGLSVLEMARQCGINLTTSDAGGNEFLRLSPVLAAHRLNVASRKRDWKEYGRMVMLLGSALEVLRTSGYLTFGRDTTTAAPAATAPVPVAIVAAPATEETIERDANGDISRIIRRPVP